MEYHKERQESSLSIGWRSAPSVEGSWGNDWRRRLSTLTEQDLPFQSAPSISKELVCFKSWMGTHTVSFRNCPYEFLLAQSTYHESFFRIYPFILIPRSCILIMIYLNGQWDVDSTPVHNNESSLYVRTCTSTGLSRRYCFTTIETYYA